MKKVQFGWMGWILLVSGNAFAFPLPQAGEVPPSASLEAFTDAGTDFTAVVALNNCSGAVVRFTDSLGTDRAMVLTNGHCLEGGFLKPGEVRSNIASSRSFNLLTKDGRGTLGSLRADRVMYASMTKTDMTLYRLTETFDDIERKFGTVALTLSNRRSTSETKITIASGYWRKVYYCTIQGFVYELREAGWSFRDSIRYSETGCETIGGTSGSPIIDSESREVVGVNNTSNENGAHCTMNNPCEVNENGEISVKKGTSYGQQTYWLYTCLNAKNEIDLATPNCQLAL